MFNNIAKQERDAAREAFHNACKLVAIDRDGRVLRFTFERNGEHFQIETMGMMSDDIEGWKSQAGLK